MRALWLLGCDARTKTELTALLTPKLTGVDYRVFTASSITELPPEHLENAGVICLMDPMNPKLPGLEYITTVRNHGFKGSVYLLGEPAVEQCVPYLRTGALTGFVPGIDRLDFPMLAALFHYQINYVGEIDLNLFLKSGGRASTEVINSFEEFTSFGIRLTTFVGRFGVSVPQIKKVLMGLALPHLKTGAGIPSVAAPFSIKYGMDPKKILISVVSHSRGGSQDTVRDRYCGVLSHLRDTKALPDSLYPEFYHVARSAENLVIFSGSATAEKMDPISLLTIVPFSESKSLKQVPISLFSFAHVVPSPELSNEVAIPAKPAESAAPAEAAPPPVAAASAPANPDADIAVAILKKESAPSGVLAAASVQDMLGDPKLVGDKPIVVDPMNPKDRGKGSKVREDAGPSGFAVEVVAPVATGEVSPNAEAIAALMEQIRVLREENETLRQTAAAMSQDLRRLLKERRLPSSDRELKESVVELCEENRLLQADRVRLIKEADDRNRALEMAKDAADPKTRAA